MQEDANLCLWNFWAAVPQNAQKPIEKGRLKGKTDINPVWRMKVLTDRFGPCGVGWKYEIVRFWNETAGNQIMAFAQINLFFKTEQGWSDPIPGVGGSMLYAQESNGMHASDEGYKMALTDAISVACKALGIGANVYWQAGESKYSNAVQTPSMTQQRPTVAPPLPSSRNQMIVSLRNAYGMSDEVMISLKSQIAARHPETAKEIKAMTDLEFNLFYSSFERMAKEWKSSKGA